MRPDHRHGKYNTDRINQEPEGLFRRRFRKALLHVPVPDHNAEQLKVCEHIVF